MKSAAKLEEQKDHMRDEKRFFSEDKKKFKELLELHEKQMSKKSNTLREPKKQERLLTPDSSFTGLLVDVTIFVFNFG